MEIYVSFMEIYVSFMEIYVSFMEIYVQNNKHLCLIHGDLCSKQ